MVLLVGLLVQCLKRIRIVNKKKECNLVPFEYAQMQGADYLSVRIYNVCGLCMRVCLVLHSFPFISVFGAFITFNH